LEISDIASNGKAVGRHDGQVIFTNLLVPGDVAEVEIYKKRRRYLEAKTLNITKASPNRIEPVCQHFGVCGGCKWQHLKYESQLEFKQNQVAENLKRLSGITLPEISDIIGSEDKYRYRNKLEFTFSNKRWLTEEEIKSGIKFNEREALGFHLPGRFDKIVDIEQCHLQEDISNKIRNDVRKYALENQLLFFDLREQVGLLRNLIIRTSTVGDLMVILVVTELNEAAEKLLGHLKKEFNEITSLQYVVNNKRNDSISDLPAICFHGKDHITEKMKQLTYKIGPKSFYQTNSAQAVLLYEIVKQFANIKGDEILYDLYTGTGTIANYMAADAKKVIGIEFIDEAVRDARENSKLNDIDNTSFFAGDLQKILNKDFFSKHGKPDVIITDPPRAGMHKDVVENIVSSGAKIVVYVSCNPATQARDLEILDESYVVTEIQPLDMFPQTSHVESVVLLKIRD